MKHIPWPVILATIICAVVHGGDGPDERQKLTAALWPPERIEQAIAAVEQQRKDGLLSDEAYARRMQMLRQRLEGTYRPQSLATADPPLNFIQNGSFEQVNRNSARNRSRWLWWGGWSWGGDYENRWEERPEYVHSGKYSARISCVGQKGRIGISTPRLPAVPGASGYRLTFWARGEGDNMLFVNFEDGATGTLRQKIPPQWQQYTVIGRPDGRKPTFMVYLYHIGEGTIWLDDVELVPEGGNLED